MDVKYGLSYITYFILYVAGILLVSLILLDNFSYHLDVFDLIIFFGYVFVIFILILKIRY